MTDRLFDDRTLEFQLRQHKAKMFDEIDHLSPETFRGADLDSLILQFTNKYRLVTPVLDEGNIYVDQNYVVPGESRVNFSVLVPFRGDRFLFRCRPHVPHPVEGGIMIRDEALELRFELTSPDANELMRQFTPHLEKIKQGLAIIENEVLLFNDTLPGLARQRLQEKQEYLRRFDQFCVDLPSLGFQLKHRNDGSEQIIIPVTQKPLPISDSAAPGRAPEPFLTLENLDEILSTIRAMVSVMERSPSVFREMEEEHLRTILLVGLNGLFEGEATAETFNGAGKTDILIRVENRNIFIAECLIWNGPDHFLGKLDNQLFRYATWRDSQLVAIVFNRNKNFSEVIEKMRGVVRDHSQCIRELDFQHESGCRYLFKREDDPDRHFILTAVAYDVPR